MDVALMTFSKLLSIPPGSLGALVDVNLCFLVSRFGGELRSLAINTPITAFQMAPRLRCVTLSSMYHDGGAVDLQCLRLPWPQLTTLKLYDMELAPDCCIAILRACVALESCSISVAFIFNPAINEIHARAEPAVILPALHTLYLSGDILHAPFLAAFHLPSLRFLELSGDHIERWSVGILTPILTPTAHTLQVLSIGETTPYISFNGDTPDQDVHALLELLPHLTVCLVKTAVCWKRSALNAIRDGKCGVRLETLRIGELYTEELLDFAEGRLRAARESAGAISVVTVLHGMYEPPLWNDSETARVQALYKAGVTIYFDLDSTYDIESSGSDSLSDETSESEGSD
ncbi:hypothetical protein BD779DRAFT_1676901 [Infundibulicybe gibba]|nr:hypothetical protein BD779DRAFT_1676901 [Infundibulicybe gibba]